MKDIKVVIGANFGDEGKGLMTDYFCGSMGGNVLNVRFNGTSQAGHTVEREGRRHVFSHFGAGSMVEGVATYLSSDFYFNPVSFFEELDKLQDMKVNPQVYLCRESEAITIYDVFVNCIVEEARGNERHGSCGAGLWEAVNRQKAGFSITAADFDAPRGEIKDKLTAIRDEYYRERMKELKLDFNENSEWYEIWNSDIAMENYITMLYDMGGCVTTVDEEEILNRWDKQVYEGAQGLLLDYDNREYMPNLTASYTGSRNVAKLVGQIKDETDIEICYVTRTYYTRHGAGRFETETARENLDPRLEEQTNVTNRWQGNFRWGYFDTELFVKTIQKDEALIADRKVTRTVAFTHANCTDEMLLTSEGRLPITEYVNRLGGDYRSYYCCLGKTAKEVEVRTRRN